LEEQLASSTLSHTTLFDDCPLRPEPAEPCPAFSTLFRTGDGSCNNRLHAYWGASFRPYQRFLPADYGDGKPRPALEAVGLSREVVF